MLLQSEYPDPYEPGRYLKTGKMDSKNASQAALPSRQLSPAISDSSALSFLSRSPSPPRGFVEPRQFGLSNPLPEGHAETVPHHDAQRGEADGLVPYTMGCELCGGTIRTTVQDEFCKHHNIGYIQLTSADFQDALCDYHTNRDWEESLEAGYPQHVSLASLEKRLVRHQSTLAAILDRSKPSPFFDTYMQETQTKTVRQMLWGASRLTGYYGAEGSEEILHWAMDNLKSDMERAVHRFGGGKGDPPGVCIHVVCPEAARLLIMEDMKCSKEDSYRILKDSTEFDLVALQRN